MAENIIYCSKCGGQSTEGAVFCQKCGAGLLPSAAIAPEAYIPVTYARTAPSPGYGGFWIRFLAFVVDTIIIRLALFPFAAVFAVMGLHSHPFIFNRRVTEADLPVIFGAFLVTACIYVSINWLYDAFLTSSSWQGTVGKKILNLKVVDEAGNRISFARATGRHFAKYYLSTILLIGYIMAAFTDRKRALHDMIAGTLVKQG